MSAQCTNLQSEQPQLAQQITLRLICGCLGYRCFYCESYTLKGFLKHVALSLNCEKWGHSRALVHTEK